MGSICRSQVRGIQSDESWLLGSGTFKVRAFQTCFPILGLYAKATQVDFHIRLLARKTYFLFRNFVLVLEHRKAGIF